MKFKSMFFLTLLATSYSFSQDLITKRNGEDIKASILEVGINEIKYKNYNNLQGPTYSLLKQDILIVQYENGTKDIFEETSNTPNTKIASINSNFKNNDLNENDLSLKGKLDAKSFYRGKNSGSGWVVVTTIFTSPLGGLIPAAICSSSEPNDFNLMYPNPTLMNNREYNNSYVNEAHKIKQNKVWKAFGISAGVWLGLFLMVSQ